MDAVLIELDGVLADTTRARREALTRALADDGVVANPDLIDALRHALALRDYPRASRALERLSPELSIRFVDDTALELLALRADRYASEAIAAGVQLLPGARELVHMLASRMRVALFSLGSRRDVETVLTLAELETVIAGVAAIEDAGSSTGHSVVRALYERLMKRDPVQASRAIVLATTPAALEQARAAGLPVAAVGPLPVHRAIEANAYLPTLDAVSVASLGHILGNEGDAP